jgi:hypothetical protein
MPRASRATSADEIDEAMMSLRRASARRQGSARVHGHRGASQGAQQRSDSTIRCLLLDCFAASGDDEVARSGPELILE